MNPAAVELGRFAAGLRWEHLASGIQDKVRQHVLDTIGVVCAGAPAPEATRVRSVLAARQGSPQAAVLACDLRLPTAAAAFLNAFQGRIHTFDDTYEAGPMHPGAVVVSAALACAERVGAGGARLLEAVAAGYEVAVRVAAAAGPAHYQAGFHATGTCNVFGAAAAAGRALGLDARGIAAALALAGKGAAGLRQYQLDGGMSDSALNGARAAFTGVEAAELAAAGLSGPPGILDGRWGFLAVMAPNGDPERLLVGLGEEYLLREVSLKPYPACRFTHGPVHALLALRERENLGAETVEAVEITTFQQSVEVSDKPRPASVSEAILSHQYAAALALLKGVPRLEHYRPGVVEDPAVGALTARVRVTCDPALDAHYPWRWPHRVVVRCRDGRTFSEHSSFPPGGPASPLPPRQVADKCQGLLGTALGPAAADRVYAQLQALERAGDVRTVTGDLAPRAGDAAPGTGRPQHAG